MEHDEFLNLIELNTTFPTIVRLLQHYNIQLLLSQLIENRPNSLERSVGWHIDGGIPQAVTEDGMRVMNYLKVGYALTDVINDDAGGLEIVPRSHKKQFKDLESTNTNDARHQGEFHDSLQLKMKAGDAVIFDQRLWHAGAKNKTDTTRVALYFGYGYATFKPFDYLSVSNDILKKCTPIGKQLLGKRFSNFSSFSYYHPAEVDVPLKKWYSHYFGDTWIK